MAMDRGSLRPADTTNHEYFVVYVDKTEREKGAYAGSTFRDPVGFAQALSRSCNEMANKGWKLFHVQPNTTESGTLGVWLYFEKGNA